MGNANSTPLDKVINSFFPPLTYTHHKGQHGKVGVVGGSSRYTGAPYYVGKTTLLLGCDMATIFCTPSAATPIKSYSPTLMVEGILPEISNIFDLAHKGVCCRGGFLEILQEESKEVSVDFEKFTSNVIQNILIKNDDSKFFDICKTHKYKQALETICKNKKSYNSLVVGSGQGNTPILKILLSDIIRNYKLIATPQVLDADGIQMLCDLPMKEIIELCETYTTMVLTTNEHEFQLLGKALQVDTKILEEKKLKNCALQKLEEFLDKPPNLDDTLISAVYNPYVYILNRYIMNDFPVYLQDLQYFRHVAILVQRVAKKLNGPTIILKGRIDIIANQYNVVCVVHPGAPKRCGGLGDILAGAIATTLAYFDIKNKQIYKGTAVGSLVEYKLEDDTTNATIVGSLLCKVAQNYAFKKNQRSLIPENIMEELPYIINHIDTLHA